MTSSRITLLILIAGFVSAFFYFDLGQYLTLDSLKAQQSALESYRAANILLSVVLYGLFYILVTGLSLPGATILTLAGGAIFGVFWGTLIVSFASSIGATLAFLASRFLFRDSVQDKFGEQFKTIDEGIAKEGRFYLFTLRLIPVFPFFMINLLMGLSNMKTWTFYWISQVGMLAGTVVYVNAGTQIGQIKSLAGILSPSVLGSFIILGLFPLLAKKVVASLRDKDNE